MKKILSKNWDFTIYQQEEEDKIISVIFFGPVDFYRSFTLLPNEQDKNLEYLAILSDKIRNNYSDFKTREITPAITRES